MTTLSPFRAFAPPPENNASTLHNANRRIAQKITMRIICTFSASHLLSLNCSRASASEIKVPKYCEDNIISLLYIACAVCYLIEAPTRYKQAPRDAGRIGNSCQKTWVAASDFLFCDYYRAEVTRREDKGGSRSPIRSFLSSFVRNKADYYLINVGLLVV